MKKQIRRGCLWLRVSFLLVAFKGNDKDNNHFERGPAKNKLFFVVCLWLIRMVIRVLRFCFNNMTETNGVSSPTTWDESKLPINPSISREPSLPDLELSACVLLPHLFLEIFLSGNHTCGTCCSTPTPTMGSPSSPSCQRNRGVAACRLST